MPTNLRARGLARIGSTPHLASIHPLSWGRQITEPRPPPPAANLPRSRARQTRTGDRPDDHKVGRITPAAQITELAARPWQPAAPGRPGSRRQPLLHQQRPRQDRAHDAEQITHSRAPKKQCLPIHPTTDNGPNAASSISRPGIRNLPRAPGAPLCVDGLPKATVEAATPCISRHQHSSGRPSCRFIRVRKTTWPVRGINGHWVVALAAESRRSRYPDDLYAR